MIRNRNESLHRRVLAHWVQSTIFRLQQKRVLTLSGAHYKLGILEKSFVMWIKFVTLRKREALAGIHNNIPFLMRYEKNKKLKYIIMIHN